MVSSFVLKYRLNGKVHFSASNDVEGLQKMLTNVRRDGGDGYIHKTKNLKKFMSKEKR